MNIDMNFVFLRLDRSHKSAAESESLTDRFCYSLKHMGSEGQMPGELVHEIEIRKNMTTENDILVAIAEAEERAIKRGLEKGMEQERAAMLDKMRALGVSEDIISQM